MNKKILSCLCCWIFCLTAFNSAFSQDLPPAQGKAKDKTAKYEVLTTAVDHKAFDKGYKFFSQKKYEKSLAYFYNYIEKHNADNLTGNVEYEWAVFFLGIALIKSDFTHAGVDILSHLVTRKPNTRIVSYSLEAFEKITRTIPFDEDLLINKVIYDQEYGFVDDRISDFINFYQGVFDWQNGFFNWGNQHFARIRANTYYDFKYQYHNALYLIYQDRIDDAIAVLKGILSGACEDEILKDQARFTLARLLFEKGDFEQAVFMYRGIKKPILEQAENLLEMAWSQYHLGHPEKAMGLLYAFEAPSFKQYFTPEYYILKSFIYKDVCHYQRAMQVVHEFGSRYTDSLKKIYNRGLPTEDQDLLLILLNKKKIKRIWRFLKLLEKEKEQALKIKDKSIEKYLEQLYSLRIEKSIKTLKREVEKSYEELADKLLKYEEEAYLMEYEIGLDMYQRVTQHHFSEDPVEKIVISELKGKVVYSFQGEFWNDELADYKVILPNKCNSMEEWDIFFK